MDNLVTAQSLISKVQEVTKGTKNFLALHFEKGGIVIVLDQLLKWFKGPILYSFSSLCISSQT